jgi:hypothetical protein
MDNSNKIFITNYFYYESVKFGYQSITYKAKNFFA